MSNTVCLVMTHGKIASALIDASKKIIGNCEHLFTLPTENSGPEQLAENITAFIEKNKMAAGIFFLVCIRGGSYWNAAIRASREFGNVKILAGVNLPMILSYVTNRNKLDFEELSDVLYNDAKCGVVTFGKERK